MNELVGENNTSITEAIDLFSDDELEKLKNLK